MSHDRLEALIRELDTGTKLILAHQHADIDAICAGIALHHSFPNVVLGIHECISRVGKKLLLALNVKLGTISDLSRFDKVVILDASTPTIVGYELTPCKRIILIDHHTPTDTWGDNVVLYYCDDTKTSCSEIVYQILKHKSIKIDENLAVCLLLGILTDTGHLRHANLNTFRTITAILEESDVKLDYVQSILETCELMDTAEMYSIKIANLKCMQRVKYEVVGEGNDPSNRVIVATSYVGAHESSACKVLLFAGADVAFVGSEHQHKVRISARAKTDIVNRGLHLAKLLQAVAEDCACESGGHAGAAGLTGYGDVETILNICASKIKAWGLSNLVR